MNEIHNAIAEGIAKELGATCVYYRYHSHNIPSIYSDGWELDWDWNILGPATIATIHDGKIKLEIPKVLLSTHDLADPNLIEQLRTKIREAYAAHTIKFDD